MNSPESDPRVSSYRDAAIILSKLNPETVVGFEQERFLTLEPESRGVLRVGLIKNETASSGSTSEGESIFYIQPTIIGSGGLDDGVEVCRCPDCKNDLRGENVQSGPEYPHIGWEYFHCPTCDNVLSTGNAETVTTTRDARFEFAKALGEFRTYIPDNVTVDSFEVDVNAESVKTQAINSNLAVPDDFLGAVLFSDIPTAFQSKRANQAVDSGLDVESQETLSIVKEVISNLDPGDGAEEDDIICRLMTRYSVTRDDAEDILHNMLMQGLCFQPEDDKYIVI